MSCLYCGRQSVWRRDGDFCNAAHRKLYHERLREGLGRLSADEPAPARTADFITALPPDDVRHHPAAGAGDLRRTPLPTRLPGAARVTPRPLPGRAFAAAFPAACPAPAASIAAPAGNRTRVRSRLRLPGSSIARSRLSFGLAPAARLHIPVTAAPACVGDSAGHASVRRPATNLRLPLFIVSSGTAQGESPHSASTVSLPAAAAPGGTAARPGRNQWTPFPPVAVLAPLLDLTCLADADSLGAAAPASPILVRPRAVRAPETAPLPRQGKLVPFSARSGVRRPDAVRPAEYPAPEVAGPAGSGAAAASGPDTRVSFTLRPWAATPAPAGVPNIATTPAEPAVSASDTFLKLEAREANSAAAILAAGPRAYRARQLRLSAECAELPAAVGLPLFRNSMPAPSCAARAAASPSRVAAFAASGTQATMVPVPAMAVRESESTGRMPVTGTFSLRGAAAERPRSGQPVSPDARPHHVKTDPAIPPIPRGNRAAAVAARTDTLLRLECPSRNIPAAPVRRDETFSAAPRMAVRKPAFAIEGFMDEIEPGAPLAPRLAAVRVIAPKPASESPAAISVNWWYRQAKAVAAALAVATALWVGVGKAGDALLGNNRLGKAIADRAAVQFSDDFRSGLSSWKGDVKGWSYQKDGYIQPGDFAIFAPSQKNRDYRLDFLTLVERHSVDWSIRTRDARNYYAMKLRVVKPGPRPEMMLVRYAVIDGRKGAPIEVPVTVPLSQDTPYVVSVQVAGDRFTASVEGQPVDTWTDHALASGGVAVFSEAGERARLYWLKVTANDDFLGKLCAILAGKQDGEVAARGPKSSWPGPWFAMSLTPGASMSASPQAGGSGNGG